MADLDRLQEDLGFVRRSVALACSTAQPPGINFLWGAIVLCGFALVDIQPRWVGAYWSVAGPAGGILTAVIAWRDGVRHGHIERTLGMRHAMHWGAFMVAAFLSGLMAIRGVVDEPALGPIILLLLATSYFQAGVHLQPTLRWVGLLLAGGFILVLTPTAYAWTIVGAATAAAFVVIGLKGQRDRVVAAQ